MKCLLSYSPAHIQRAPTALLLNISQQLLSLRLMLMNLLSFNENELKIDFSFPELLKTSINDNLLYQLFFKIAQICRVSFYAVLLFFIIVRTDLSPGIAL